MGDLFETHSYSLVVAAVVAAVVVAAVAGVVVVEPCIRQVGCKLAVVAVGTLRWEGLRGQGWMQQEEGPGSADSADIHSSAAGTCNTRNQAAESALAAAAESALVAAAAAAGLGDWVIGMRSKEIVMVGGCLGIQRAAWR